MFVWSNIRILYLLFTFYPKLNFGELFLHISPFRFPMKNMYKDQKMNLYVILHHAW